MVLGVSLGSTKYHPQNGNLANTILVVLVHMSVTTLLGFQLVTPAFVVEVILGI